MDLTQLQREHQEWLAKNFPKQEPHQPLLGLAEEVGELSHAHLKAEQLIREHTGGFAAEAYMTEAIDAVGDIVIYLASYCTAVGIDLDAAVESTWNRVSARDWTQDPITGGDWPLREEARR